MATARPVGKSRRSTEAAKEDLHVRISETPDVPETSPGEGGRYVYGIVETKEHLNFGKIGIGGAGEPVYTVNHQDIAAVVSKTPVAIFDPTRENALAHEHVIETVMKNHTIIPMSFGTVFRTDDDIRQVLKSIYLSLKDVLNQMAGKLEFGLKVNWDRDQIIEELQQQDEELRRFHHEIVRKQLQSTYFARMQLDKMIMNAAFLVERDRETEFDAVVNKIAKKYGKRLKFKYTGPWPPYNFVNIRLKLERLSPD